MTSAAPAPNPVAAVRAWLLAGRRADGRDAGRGRRDAAHRVRPVDRRMEAGHRRAAAARRDAWQAEFAKYKTIPQYRELNRGMSLDEFKTIYWWEWSHRLLARADRRRVPAAVPVVPLARLDRAAAAARLWTIFGLGALLGAVGWWMVSSGLADRVSVSQYRLAFHLTLACVIYAMVLWTAQRLAPRERLAVPARIRTSAIALLVPGAGADLSRRAGRRPARRAHLQHLAADRRRARARRVAAVVRAAAVAQFLREHAHRAVQSPHGRLRAFRSRRCCTPSTSRAR